jgi:hypothetical protein
MGSIFSAYDIRGRLGETLTVEYAWGAGKAFAEWLSNDGPVIVATATQDANNEITHAFIEGILLLGRDVIHLGQRAQLAPNDIIDHKAAGAVVISHDGVQNLEILTFYDVHGGAVTADNGLTEISGLIDADNFLPAVEKGTLVTDQQA